MEAGHHPLIPQMRLDELLAEPQVRLTAVPATRDRVHALLEAVVSVGSDLDLETVLRRIVETATTPVDASYGALGVVGQENTLLQFIPVGPSEEEIARIEHWPHGLGLLGLLIKDARPLRLRRISDHPESYGFPPGHPPMGTFLGVPIRVRDEVFGNLHLTEKRGGGEFDEEDEAVVIALATAAGVAVENARLYEESRSRETWLQASSEVTTSPPPGADPRQVLSVVAARVHRMSDADVVLMLLPDASRQALVVEVVEGEGAQELEGTSIELSSTLAGRRLHPGEVVSSADLPTAGIVAARRSVPGIASQPLILSRVAAGSASCPVCSAASWSAAGSRLRLSARSGSRAIGLIHPSAGGRVLTPQWTSRAPGTQVSPALERSFRGSMRILKVDVLPSWVYAIL
ncbi:GAF domain-containing protein [Nonomuraea fuscirosea]|uniref:GAF domain-containing protein n=1 Tax=Nonomuraea fuscirosea TaxID=1291556 RepID=UPI0034405842